MVGLVPLEDAILVRIQVSQPKIYFFFLMQALIKAVKSG